MEKTIDKRKDLGAFIFAIKMNGKSFVTWGTDWRYDEKKEEVYAINDFGKPCYTIRLSDLDFEQLDIYDKKKPENGPVQTFLPKPEVVMYA